MREVDGRRRVTGAELVVGPRARGELLSIINPSGLVLDGISYCPATPQLVVVHVHGSLGNFYQQAFIRVFAKYLMAHGVGLLAFNLTAHDGIAEGYAPDGDMKYVGGSLSSFETCLGDLDAMVSVAQSICPNVVLQGHSLGCDRVLYYAEQREARIPLILLSPCDSHRLQETWLDGEEVAAQVQRLSAVAESASEVELIAPCEYGVKGSEGWTYSIPIGRRALLSIMTGAAFRTLHLDRPARVVSDAAALVYLGEADAIRGAPLQDMADHVRQLLPSAEILQLSGDHSLEGCEETVAGGILTWACSVGLLEGL